MNLIYQCPDPKCDLRFILSDREKKPSLCPRCGSPLDTFFIHDEPSKRTNPIPYNQVIIEILLDNLRSTLNVGSIFRSADGAGIKKIHLCGITPTPDHPKITKTGLGAEWSVPWDYHPNGLKFVLKEKQKGIHLICIETNPRSISIFSFQPLKTGKAILLIMGNEITGVDPGIESLCDETLYIPMMGYKKSLNVSVAFGIVAYQLSFARF
jgi:23S rRNA (guanosine2251-2'-O)-methyltransferase